MVNIIINNLNDNFSINEDLIEKIKKTIIECEKEEHINFLNEISVTLTNNEEIKSLNNEFRNIDSETDVLSFPIFEKDELENEIQNNENQKNDNSKDEIIKPLGDIVISLEKAKEQSIEYNHSFDRELCYLVCHSMFHLMGYDHMNDDDKRIMRGKEKKIMQILNILK